MVWRTPKTMKNTAGMPNSGDAKPPRVSGSNAKKKGREPVTVHFADSYRSWKKGAVENANRPIRRYIPKQANFNGFSDSRIKAIQYRLNRRPWEKINFDTPMDRCYGNFAFAVGLYTATHTPVSQDFGFRQLAGLAGNAYICACAGLAPPRSEDWLRQGSAATFIHPQSPLPLMDNLSLFSSVAFLIGVIVVLSIFFHFVPFFLWLSAKVSGVRISLIQLFLMRIRNVPPSVIVPSLIEAHKAGLSNITRDNLEAHYMTGGHVQRVVHALVSASKANIDLSFEKATAIDLAGRDVFEAVQTSVNPKVIDTPPVAAVAKNGIQLIAKARVTVRANIHQLVGGAGEDTILARVGEGIVSSIGSADSHEQVLENPDSISKLVLRKGLDAGTAYEILSIDIADIDVGKNIGATLQMDQANADKNIAQAKAEERRAMAVATEQEMKARAQEARAEVIQAEAEVPKALAQALREGNMGFMDYYRLENLKGDTAMRDTIAKINPKDLFDKK